MRETAALVGARIRSMREAAGLKQGELATRLAKNQTTVSQWESGKRLPGVDDLVSMARVLDCDLGDLFPDVAPRRSAPMIMRAVAESLELDELKDALENFLLKAEDLPRLSRKLEVSAARPLRAAQELLARAQRHEPQAVRPPIDVHVIARLCGVRVLAERFVGDLSGVLIELEDGPVIGYHRWQSAGRQRFTVAHELGHHLLRHHDKFHIDLAVTGSAEGDSPLFDWRLEREANDFAANILMPSTLVRDAFYETASVPGLAQQFGVSEIAMGYRLVNLGLR